MKIHSRWPRQTKTVATFLSPVNMDHPVIEPSALFVPASEGPLGSLQEDEPYNAFQILMTDDTERITQRLYDLDYRKHIQLAERRIALQLALRYFKDANQSLGSVVSSIGPKDIVLLEGDDEMNYVHLLFSSNLLPYTSLKATDLANTTLESSQTLIITDEVQVPPEGLSRITEFVAAGGRLFFFIFLTDEDYWYLSTRQFLF